MRVGVTPHSVRACSRTWLEELGRYADRERLVLHIHADEQPKEIEGCLEHSVIASDQRINARVDTIFRLIHTSADRTAFVQGEQSWLRYRRRSCSATASKYRGGSGEPIAFLTCEKSRNARHLADLADTERVLRQR